MSAKNTSDAEATDLNTEIALFRYGLIAQLVHTPPDKGHQEALLREIAARPYRIPGSKRKRLSVTTLRRYLKTYHADGFDALRPVQRADAGTPRAFPPQVLEKAIALRQEQPARTTQTLVDILQRDEQLSFPRAINVHTLTTHLRQRGQTRRLVGQSAKVYQRFERDHVNRLRRLAGRCAGRTLVTRSRSPRAKAPRPSLLLSRRSQPARAACRILFR